MELLQGSSNFIVKTFNKIQLDQGGMGAYRQLASINFKCFILLM